MSRALYLTLQIKSVFCFFRDFHWVAWRNKKSKNKRCLWWRQNILTVAINITCVVILLVPLLRLQIKVVEWTVSLSLLLEIRCCKHLAKLKRVSSENKQKQAIIVNKTTARSDQPSVHFVCSAVLAFVFLTKNLYFFDFWLIVIFFYACWERLILHGFLLWYCTLTLHYYYYYYYYYYYVIYFGMVWWCCLYIVKHHQLRTWVLYK